MRRIKTLLLVGLAFWYAAEGFAQRGIGTNLPDRSSVLHLESGTRGLLIPRVTLKEIVDAYPINAPANSLLIYNTSDVGDEVNEFTVADVRPGYYYWDTALNGGAGAWTALLDSKSAGKNIMIDSDGTISIKPGASNHQVLVTIIDDSDPDPTNHTITSEWVNASDILADLLDIDGRNGITVVPEIDDDTDITTFQVELGGTLIKETIITTDDNKFEIKTGVDDGDGNITPGENFFISNLNEIEVENDGTITGTGTTADPNIPGDTDTPGDTFKDFFDVLIVNKTTGLVQRVSVEDLLKDAVAVANGLWYDPADGLIKLGGPLIEDTTITLDGNEFIIDTSEIQDNDPALHQDAGDFKIIGLTETASDANLNQILVLDENNVVRTVRRVISKDITGALDMTDLETDWPEYSPYVQEVNINVTALDAETDLVLPVATAANEGQVINIKLTIGSESGNYLNIKKEAGTVADNTNILTWGALPFQGWVLKSDGSKWRVVSSN